MFSVDRIKNYTILYLTKKIVILHIDTKQCNCGWWLGFVPGHIPIPSWGYSGDPAGGGLYDTVEDIVITPPTVESFESGGGAVDITPVMVQ